MHMEISSIILVIMMIVLVGIIIILPVILIINIIKRIRLKNKLMKEEFKRKRG